MSFANYLNVDRTTKAVEFNVGNVDFDLDDIECDKIKVNDQLQAPEITSLQNEVGDIKSEINAIKNDIISFKADVLDTINQILQALQIDHTNKSITTAYDLKKYRINRWSTYSETANATARAGLQTQIDNANTATTNAITNLQQEIDDNKTDIEGKLATETSARLSLENAHNTRNTFVDGEISRLDGLHTNDSARLDAVEAAQATVNTDIEAKIQARIDAHNADLSNTLPRLSKIEEYLEIDETDPSNPVVRIKAGVQFEVSGNFIQS
eukprot:jgi/Bigna1/126454/aug1.2_g1162